MSWRRTIPVSVSLLIAAALIVIGVQLLLVEHGLDVEYILGMVFVLVGGSGFIATTWLLHRKSMACLSLQFVMSIVLVCVFFWGSLDFGGIETKEAFFLVLFAGVLALQLASLWTLYRQAGVAVE